MTRSTLLATIKRYLNFTAIADEDLDVALDRTREENGRLRVPENAKSISVNPESGMVFLPPDFKSLRRVVGVAGELLAGPSIITDLTKRRYGGPATMYNLDGNVLHINTISDSPIEVSYWCVEDRLGPNAEDTTPILTAYPGLFTHRCCAELALITQDRELAADHLAQYDRLFAQIQKDARLQQGGRGVVAVGA